MKYVVDGWNNFCRVFELPSKFSEKFCFGGGIPTNFQMVDWFNPIEGLPQVGVSKEVWKEKVGEIQTVNINEEYIQNEIVPYVLEKNYIKNGSKYLILFDFGASITFEG